MNKPFSQSCENNKHAILTVLKKHLNNDSCLLEIGSGTGQHAVYFAENLPKITWQTSDKPENHQGIQQWLSAHPAPNLLPPVHLDLNHSWPIKQTDHIFSANTLHIISWPLVESFFDGVKTTLNTGGMLCLYGPFNYQGKYSSTSNAKFDDWLKERDKESGIRDFESILEQAKKAQLSFIEDIEMPANNRMLVFKKQ